MNKEQLKFNTNTPKDAYVLLMRSSYVNFLYEKVFIFDRELYLKGAKVLKIISLQEFKDIIIDLQSKIRTGADFEQFT